MVRILYFAPFYAMGIFYKKILEKYVDRIPSVVYFAIVFAAKLMIFLPNTGSIIVAIRIQSAIPKKPIIIV